jgi:probable F420-dependent oxidoreductase
MRLGITLPHVGRAASTDAIATAAGWAETSGYDSVWVVDRVLAAEDPRSPIPGTVDPTPPDEMRVSFDPILSLAVAATATRRVRVGTSVLVAPWYPATLLARSLTTLDHLSSGRLTVGLGLGWSLDEYEAVGVPMRHLGSRLDETIDVLDAVWSPGVVSHCGPRVRITPSSIEPKPLQVRPPLLLAGYRPAGLDRIARRADGWIPSGLPIDAVGPMWRAVRDLAAGHGRRPDDLELVVRANVHLTDGPLGAERATYHGNLEQVCTDLDATRATGADEIILDLPGQNAHDVEAEIEQYGAITRAADLLPAAA